MRLCVFTILLLSSISLFCGCRTNVLGRTVRLDVLCGDFESEEWLSSCYKDDEDAAEVWHPSPKGGPELLRTVPTPTEGLNGSRKSLEIRTNAIDSDETPYQEELVSPYFSKIFGRHLTQADQPVFIVRVWLPPFYQWGDYYAFAFRQAVHNHNRPNPEYYPSIWLRYNNSPLRPFQKGANFYFRIGTDDTEDQLGKPIPEAGWWTLVIAFDDGGVGHYYASPGTDAPTEADEMFDTTQFETKSGAINPFMQDVAYSFFSIAYLEQGNVSPQIAIDNFEVWVVKQDKPISGKQSKI